MTRFIAVLLLLSVPAAAQGAALVELAPVEAREMAARRSFVGSVEPVRVSTVGSEAEGRVMTFTAREGRRVKSGEPLATLRTTRIEIQLRSARALLELRRKELLELENGARKEEIAEARARVAGAQAAVDIRVWKRENARKLVESKTISPDAFRDAELAARVAEHLLAQAEASLALVLAGPRAERIAQAQARVDIQLAEVARLEDDKKRHTIRAPFDGYVLEEHTEVGQWLDKGGVVARVAALHEVDVVVSVLEDYIDALRIGAKRKVRFDAIPGRTFDATVAAIVPRADRRTRTFPVKLRLPNDDRDGRPLLRAGLVARMDLAVGPKRKVLLVPKDAVVLGGPRPAIFTVDPKDNTARRVEVELGIAVDGKVEVVRGLAEGQRVVVRGNERLRPNQPVRTAER